MMKDLNVRPDTIKLLEDNKGRTLFVINHSKIFFNPPVGTLSLTKEARIYNGEKTASSISGAEKLDSYM